MPDHPEFDPSDVARAVQGLCKTFAVPDLTTLHRECCRGMHPDLLAYEKTGTSSSLPVLTRYILGAGSYLAQPVQFYDIFEVNRAIYIVQWLETAISVLKKARTLGLEERLDRLQKAKTFDDFDSIVFELLVAWRYCEAEGITKVEFVPETPKNSTPDLKMLHHGKEAFVEAKKMNRIPQHAIKTNTAVNAVVGSTLDAMKKAGVSAVFDAVFTTEPENVDPARFLEAATAALDRGTEVVQGEFTVAGRKLARWNHPQLQLCPSPGFYYNRYGYRLFSDWMGIVPRIEATFAGPGMRLFPGGKSTWMDKITWDCAVKWRLDSPDLIARYQRFGFETGYKGVTQVHKAGTNSSVHIWLESAHFMGGRTGPIVAFKKHLEARGATEVGWVVINEMLFDVSAKGKNDMIEHAHFLKGPRGIDFHPVVSNVLTDGTLLPTAAFGAGHPLPDIDSIR